jgi:hypothetical protein
LQAGKAQQTGAQCADSACKFMWGHTGPILHALENRQDMLI